jgi:hypothetical protein
MLQKLQKSKGGTYITSGYNSVSFHLYTGTRFVSVQVERHNFTVGLLLDTPPGGACGQREQKQSEFWQHSKCLQQGNLVALVLISPGTFKVFIGIIQSTGADIAESAKADAETIHLRISFFDAEIELMALCGQQISVNSSTYAVLVDNSIMFTSLHPFLRTLQHVEPTCIPFSDIISYSGDLRSLGVRVPRYARVPQFCFDLQCLAQRGTNITSLDINSATSVGLARQQLSQSSNLDPSQVHALVDALTCEVSLIQGCVLCSPLITCFSLSSCQPSRNRKGKGISDKDKYAKVLISTAEFHREGDPLCTVLQQNKADRCVTLLPK